MRHKLENKINDLVTNLLNDYNQERTIDKINTFDHPDKEAIIEILDKLRKIIYPGYYRNKSYKVYTVRNSISMLLEDVIYNLVKQISVVLEYVPAFENVDESKRIEKAEEMTFAFLQQLPKIRAYIETDVQAAFDGDPAAYNKDEIIFS